MPHALNEPARGARTALVQVLVLVGLALVLYLPDLVTMQAHARRDLEGAHSFAGPVLLVLMVLLRRGALAESLGRGSVWGVGLIGVGLAVFVSASWPFNYGYPRWLSLVPVLGGAILVVGGWRLLWRSLPILLLLLLTIPMGSRYYARLIIKPETITLDVVTALLDMLPGVFVELNGPDMSFGRAGEAGHIALGEPHRGASLLLSCLVIAVFVTYARVRPWWQIVAMAVAAVPIVLICNVMRLIAWGLVSIYGGTHPASPAPRIIASVLTLLLAWGLSVLALAVIRRVIVEEEPAGVAGPAGGAGIMGGTS